MSVLPLKWSILSENLDVRKTELIYNKKLDHAYVAYKYNFIVGLLDSYHGVGMCATTQHQQTGLYSALSVVATSQ